MQEPIWRKSTRSGDPSIGTCVELADLGAGRRGVRDSKDPRGPVLTFAPAALAALATQIRNGVHDL